MSRFVSVSGEDPMSTLCRMVKETGYDDLPGDVVEYARLCILETMAVIVGGSSADGIAEIVRFVKDKGGKPESIIPFYGGRVPASEAALVLGPMARALDLAGGHVEGGHCTEYIVPALLAAAGLRERVSGKEFILAFVLGQEVLIRIGMAFRLVSEGIPRGYQGGHYTFGAIAAAAKLLGLNMDELENAEGIGRGTAQPHDSAMYEPPTLMVRVHHGFVCQSAINACLLARAGITGPRGEYSNVLTGPRGYLSFAKWETDPAALTEELGERWEMMNILMKPYSSCGCTHTPIDGLLDQMRLYNFDVDDIARIDIDVPHHSWTVVCIPEESKWNPQTIPECQFSLPYTVATAAYEKDFFLDAFMPEARARQDVRELMTRIHAKEDPALPLFSSRVNVTLKNGETCAKEYYYFPEGQPKVVMTEAQLIDKFRKCVPFAACKLGDNAVNSVIDAILNLERVDDIVDALLVPFTPS